MLLSKNSGVSGMLPSWIKDRTHDYLADGRGWFQRDVKGIEILTVHHTASILNDTEDNILKSIFGTHNGKNGWPGFAYHYFYIPKRFAKGYSGKWIKMNNETDVTWHDTVNWDSLGICIHGYYHPDINNTLEAEDFENIKKMLDWLSTQNPQFPAGASNVFGHRDRSQTACPGNYLYPYVTEYRTKVGAVDWTGEEDDNLLSLDHDVPTFVEEKYDLKSFEWYDKYWTLDQLIKDGISTHAELTMLQKKYEDLKKENTTNEGIIKNQIEEIKGIKDQRDSLQKMNQELTVQIGIVAKEKEQAIKERDEYKGDLKTRTTERDDLQKEKDEILVPEITRLKNQDFTFGESLGFLIRALLNGRWKK